MREINAFCRRRNKRSSCIEYICDRPTPKTSKDQQLHGNEISMLSSLVLLGFSLEFEVVVSKLSPILVRFVLNALRFAVYSLRVQRSWILQWDGVMEDRTCFNIKTLLWNCIVSSKKIGITKLRCYSLIYSISSFLYFFIPTYLWNLLGESSVMSTNVNSIPYSTVQYGCVLFTLSI